MKKLLSIALVVVLVLGLSTLAFGDSFLRPFGFRANESIENRQGNYFGPGHMMGYEALDEEDAYYGYGHMRGFGYRFNEHPIEMYAELTDQTVENIFEQMESGKTLFEIAEEDGNLDRLNELLLANRQEQLSTFVQEGRLTQAEADELSKNIESNINNSNCFDYSQPSNNSFRGGMMRGGRQF